MNKNSILWLVGIIVVILGVVWLVRTPAKAGNLDTFAQCLTDSGAKYYGAFWCPNCKNQEAMFGRSAKLLPRIECSTPDGKRQVAECSEAGITGYPSWDFASSTRVTGTQSLESLSEKSGCPLPSEQADTTESSELPELSDLPESSDVPNE